MKKVLLSLLIIIITVPCFAKAAYYGKKHMINNADCIVIVNISDVDKVNIKGEHWTYGEKATATVEQCLKGDVKGKIEILGMENFICAQCKYKKGRFLLFLRKDGEYWKGCNWYLGIRPIKDKNVEWFASDDSLKMKEKPLDKVIGNIKEILKEKKIED